MMEPTEEFHCEYMYMGVYDVGEEKQVLVPVCRYFAIDTHTCRYNIAMKKCPLGHGKTLKWLGD